MAVERYVAWVASAPVESRCRAVTLLAEVATDPDGPSERRFEALAMLMRATADGSVDVRRHLVRELASRGDVPRSLIWQLSQDVPAVSAPLFETCRDISTGELIDAVRTRETDIQTAIARRPAPAAPLARALAETGCRDAVLTLLDNETVVVGPALLTAIAMRFRDDAAMRGRLLDRDDLPVAARADLVHAVADDLQAFAARFMPNAGPRADRIGADAGAMAIVRFGASLPSHSLPEYALGLRESGRLTPNVLLRSVAEGAMELLAHMLAVSADLSARRVARLIRRPRASAIRQLAHRCGLAPAMGELLHAGLLSRARGGDWALCLHAMLRTADEAQADAAVIGMLARMEGEAARAFAFADAAPALAA